MNTNSEAIVTLLGERIKQRSENVAQAAEQRRAKREINVSTTENPDYFNDNFSLLKKNVDIKLEEACSIDKSQLLNYLDEMVEDIKKMQKFLNESSLFLASFQIKKAQETINVTNDLVQICIQELQPKKKFGFISKKMNDSQVHRTNKAIDSVDTVNPYVGVTDQLREKMFYGFKDCSNETLIKSSEELKNRQVNLLNLVNCKVIALGNPSSLQFSCLRDTTVIVGPTSRSAFIKDCYNCVFVLACQQIRIHNTEDAKFYIHVTGAAIIENCKNVAFGPYTLQYEDLNKHYKESELALNINQWKNVEDFHWLNENEKSPNFKLIDEESWEKNWV